MRDVYEISLVEAVLAETNQAKKFAIFETLPTPQLVEVLFRIYHSPQKNSELITLMFEELVRRGTEGRAALQWISQDSSEIGDCAKAIAANEEITVQAIEKAAHVPNRFSEFMPEFDDIMKFLEDTFAFMQSKDIYKRKGMNFKDFCASVYYSMMDRRPVQVIDGAIEEEIITFANTFGVFEPAYIEMIGPAELLRLRNKTNPLFLLLGSLGHYSAEEFSAFTKKINRKSQPLILDRGVHQIPRYLKVKGKDDAEFVIGDVLEMPIRSDSVDCICTNHLIHALYMGNKRNSSNEAIEKLFTEVFRVLSHGGSFVMCEQVFDEYRDSENGHHNTEGLVKTLVNLARKNGLIFEGQGVSHQILFRQDVISPSQASPGATIDEFGFGHYEHLPIKKNKNPHAVVLKFKKQ